MKREVDAPSAGAASAGATSVDGRTARRERGRQAVIEAVVELLHEGHAPPPTALVTERAQVSEATLYRYFETIADLQMQASQRFIQTHAHLFDVPSEGNGPLPSRIDRFVTARSALWEAIAPVARLGRARAFDNPGMAELLVSTRRGQAAQVARHFAPELEAFTPAARDDLVAAITVATAFEAWDIQRTDLGRSPTQIRRTWRTSLRALLAER